MSDAERYQQAARRASTARRYAQAIEHFEGEWGGLLPASSVSVVRYLAAFGAQLSASTLRTHLAALAQWHQQRGFVDPTKTAQVRDTLRGIQALHPQPVKQAPALQLKVLEASIEGMSADVHSALPALRLRAARDQALILLGFWRAFRGDELCRLQVEHLRIVAGEGMQLFLPSSKTDRDNRGRNLTMPALKRLCPVQATEQWLTLSGIQQGPLFRGIDRWGHLSAQPLNANSVSRLLRRALLRSGVNAEGYSAHSLRRGFATWANANQWNTKALMDYVGWRDIQTAARYIDSKALFGVWAE
ncbi:TPA: site-specific integrase [Pseudomonas putida]|uniref:site-specific integrase n=1 Tax=Pseudomonas putida TaxID=303 RepID=UPI002364707B|nr:site-specific integrase [Pseudomonas putida]MDD2010297.1 site-specific integrase [Pseudomonas putida]HDS1776883.1 site-specific integrase [Pseudomonas putida]